MYTPRTSLSANTHPRLVRGTNQGHAPWVNIEECTSAGTSTFPRHALNLSLRLCFSQRLRKNKYNNNKVAQVPRHEFGHGYETFSTFLAYPVPK